MAPVNIYCAVTSEVKAVPEKTQRYFADDICKCSCVNKYELINWFNFHLTKTHNLDIFRSSTVHGSAHYDLHTSRVIYIMTVQIQCLIIIQILQTDESAHKKKWQSFQFRWRLQFYLQTLAYTFLYNRSVLLFWWFNEETWRLSSFVIGHHNRTETGVGRIWGEPRQQCGEKIVKCQCNQTTWALYPTASRFCEIRL